MGLFSRQNKDGQTASSARRQRTGASSESQARSLRVKARRRLAGALALVLAAVVVLPMVLDSEPVPVATDVAVSIPELIARPVAPAVVADASDATATPGSEETETAAPPAAPEAPLNLPPVTPPARVPAPPAPPPAVDTQRPTTPPAETRPPARTPAPAPTPAPATTPSRDSQRTDDGAVALALLEGRNVQSSNRAPAARPSTSQGAAQQGRFVLQVAAYTTEASAAARRNELHAAGITNAYVEPVTAGGKRQFRLRVGPFPSRDAAQAAQARMRTLGYDNGFIAPQ
ncbi:DedD protein [Kerstersia gyiorum]|uniref:DedD protein n=1 Tax=Kerstersia gyiorum TaxID=206506 RepID=A0A4Q7MPL1_9BURK|nr:SPOR domain-containing protein [Kerstersia gyiorum]KAB0543144.1 SPOR domain-containing protein [Kerstersia gyiorum]RZS70558.1 DedD protein [Kerstersia gyiorum]